PSGSYMLNTLGRVDAPDRTALIISDVTRITAETFGSSLLSQFEDLKLRYVRLSFIDDEVNAAEVSTRINQHGRLDGKLRIVFSTLVNARISDIVQAADALYLNLIATFVEPLEQELGAASSHGIGRFHRITSPDKYRERIEAINFALSHDDGQLHAELNKPT